MLLRLCRPATVVLSVLLATTLVACGDESASEGGLERLEAVTIEGEPGTEPEVTWKGQMSADEVETETIVEGDGAEVAEGDKIDIHYWIASGFSQRKSVSTYDDGGKPETVTASKDLAPVFEDALVGQTIGSRVAVTGSADAAFGEGAQPPESIGNKDAVLLIIDLIGEYVAPEPTDVPQSQQPRVVEKGGTPTGLDFAGLAKPKADGELLRTVLTEGKGKVITEDMKLKVNYLGSVYDAKKPFDENFSGEPTSFELTGVVQGWTFGLSGVKAGSRVLLTIPPDLGYADQEQANIPAGSTLYFVIDVLAAS